MKMSFKLKYDSREKTSSLWRIEYEICGFVRKKGVV